MHQSCWLSIKGSYIPTAKSPSFSPSSFLLQAGTITAEDQFFKTAASSSSSPSWTSQGLRGNASVVNQAQSGCVTTNPHGSAKAIANNMGMFIHQPVYLNKNSLLPIAGCYALGTFCSGLLTAMNQARRLPRFQTLLTLVPNIPKFFGQVL